MNHEEQLAFFARVDAKYSLWAISKVSGYVAGVVDEDRMDGPNPAMILALVDKPNDLYALGYMAGFADARGEDVLDTDWWKQYGEKLEYRWWKD